MSKKTKVAKKINWPTIRVECIKQLGWAMIYMRYLHDDINWDAEWKHDRNGKGVYYDNGGQAKRVERLCWELKLNQNKDDEQYWVEFLKRIEDETENMC